MGRIFGGGGSSSGGEKAASGVLAAQRAKIAEALAGYNERSTPFFGLEQRRGEFGESFFPDLAQRIRNPTLSPSFKLYANEGMDMLRNKFAQTGSPSSGRGQIATGRYLEGLAAGQLDRTDQMLMGAVNQRGQLPVTQEPQYLGLQGDLTQGIAAATKADKAKGGFNWGGLFGGLVGLGSNYLFPGSGGMATAGPDGFY